MGRHPSRGARCDIPAAGDIPLAQTRTSLRDIHVFMYILPPQFASTFRQLQRLLLSHLTCRLVLFVAALDIDAVCAARVLSNVLKKELLQYQLIPVSGYEELKRHFDRMDGEVANVVLLGCGAMMDIEAFVEAETSHRHIYIIDGHRPWSLDNLFGSRVVCFDDGAVEALQTEKLAYEALASEEEQEEEEEEEDEEKESQRDKHEDTVQQYYHQGTTIATSVTGTVYALLSTIGETSIDNLWLSVIGTTFCDILFPQVYEKFFPLYKEEVVRLSPEKSEKNADTALVTMQQDYHLFLLRHWTLYDAFYYLSHVNSKLNLWTEEGRKRLHKMFAKMGISLAVAQQKWIYMDTATKKKLPGIFAKYLPSYGLDGIIREGFIRTYGFHGQLSAMECVEALSSLLEDDFWLAWDGLSKFEAMVGGIEAAKLKQQIVFKTGTSLLERKLVKNLKLYRLCVLNDGIPDLHVFLNPLVLTKLGNWLLENITEVEFSNGSLTSLKPLVVASLNVETNTYLVIGLAPKYPRGLSHSERAKFGAVTTRLNTFSVAFQEVAETSGARVKLDSFESSIIEIEREDLSPFLERITLSGLI